MEHHIDIELVPSATGADEIELSLYPRGHMTLLPKSILALAIPDSSTALAKKRVWKTLPLVHDPSCSQFRRDLQVWKSIPFNQGINVLELDFGGTGFR